MTIANATFYAAIIAAFVSFLNLVFSRNQESRMAHRRILEPFIGELGLNIHQVLACTSTYLKRSKENLTRDQWRKRADKATENLKTLRWKVRYPLWGIDEGLRTLSRFFDWITHLEKNETEAENLFRAGDKLRAALDSAICNSYRNGRPPNWLNVLRIRCLSRKVKQIQSQAMKQKLLNNVPFKKENRRFTELDEF